MLKEGVRIHNTDSAKLLKIKKPPQPIDTNITLKLSKEDVLEIHRLLRLELDRANHVSKIDKLIKITNKIEEQTEDYFVWY